jgi:hypothetical protein
MRAMRKRVHTHDVARWADDFLRVLERSAAANEHLLEDLAGDDDVAVPVVPPDLPETGSVTTRDTSGSAQAGSMDVDVDLSTQGGEPAGGDLADVGARASGGEQVER